MTIRRMEEERVNEEFPIKLSKFLKVRNVFKVIKMHKCLPKVILILIWKEVLRFQRCLIGRLERFSFL